MDVVWRFNSTYRDLLDIQRAQPRRYPFLLESVTAGAPSGRYDILFGFPGQELILDRAGALLMGPQGLGGRDFLGALEAWRQREGAAESCPPDLPFHGGWFVYLGYELAAQIEPVLNLPAGDAAFPVAYACRLPAAIVQDHFLRRTILVAEAGDADLLETMASDLVRPVIPGPVPLCLLETELQEDEQAHFDEGVRAVKRYIHDGDVFQVNLSRGWQGQLRREVDDAALYARLRRSNPGPFAGLMTLEGRAIISSSPERLVRIAEGGVETRPIAGTYPRRREPAQDLALARALLAHPKERAEHIMLIDLERNDLGRVCAPGSVEVSELMQLESYTHVHHIVSRVEGRLKDGVTPSDVLRAVFPGGTITGCPKVRCMEIIAELEQAGRGPYTGAMGYLNRDGTGDFNILIRTMARAGRRVSFRAGAGIVADSDPGRELDETRQKARGLIDALEGGGG